MCFCFGLLRIFASRLSRLFASGCHGTCLRSVVDFLPRATVDLIVLLRAAADFVFGLLQILCPACVLRVRPLGRLRTWVTATFFGLIELASWRVLCLGCVLWDGSLWLNPWAAAVLRTTGWAPESIELWVTVVLVFGLLGGLYLYVLCCVLLCIYL